MNVLELLADLFYYEANCQVIWLAKLDLVKVLEECHPWLKTQREFARVLTNVVMLNKEELAQASFHYFSQICSTNLPEAILDHFLLSQSMPHKEEALYFFAKVIV